MVHKKHLALVKEAIVLPNYHQVLSLKLTT